jgi:N-acyl homoserine lactone hydrolase
MLKLHAMTCGWLEMPSPLLLEGVEGVMAVPLPSFLIEHPKGTVLFDSGLPLGMQGDKDAQRGEVGDVAYQVEPRFKAGEEVGARLRAADRDPEKIDILINSHLHPDHAGGNAQIPNARLIVQEREWLCGCSPDCTEHFMNPAHYDLGHDKLLVDGEHDVFGDGSIVCIPTYGHTVGHQSLRLKLDGGEVILTADACYLRKTFEDLHLPGLLADRDAMLESLGRLRASRDKGAKLVVGHDPDLWPHLNQGPLEELSLARISAAPFS